MISVTDLLDNIKITSRKLNSCYVKGNGGADLQNVCAEALGEIELLKLQISVFIIQEEKNDQSILHNQHLG